MKINLYFFKFFLYAGYGIFDVSSFEKLGHIITDSFHYSNFHLARQPVEIFHFNEGDQT